MVPWLQGQLMKPGQKFVELLIQWKMFWDVRDSHGSTSQLMTEHGRETSVQQALPIKHGNENPLGNLPRALFGS